MEIKFYGAFVLNRRVVLHAIDATPARCAPDALVDFHTVRDDEERARELRAALAEGVAAQCAQRDVLVAAADRGRGDLAQEEAGADVRGPQTHGQRGRWVESGLRAHRRYREDAAADHVARYQGRGAEDAAFGAAFRHGGVRFGVGRRGEAEELGVRSDGALRVTPWPPVFTRAVRAERGGQTGTF